MPEHRHWVTSTLFNYYNVVRAVSWQVVIGSRKHSCHLQLATKVLLMIYIYISSASLLAPRYLAEEIMGGEGESGWGKCPAGRELIASRAEVIFHCPWRHFRDWRRRMIRSGACTVDVYSACVLCLMQFCIVNATFRKVDRPAAAAARRLLCRGYNYDSTSIRRPFDWLSKAIKVTVT